MDMTKVFVATVKAIRLQMKSEPDLLNKSKKKRPSKFSMEAQNVYCGIMKLKEFLLMSRRDYIDSTGFLLSGSECRMNENERDKMDSEIQDFLVSCADQIRRVHKLYNEQTSSVTLMNQVHIHKRLICEFLEDNLKSVCMLHSEQKAIRAKRIVDKKKNCRLQLARLHKKHLESPNETIIPTRSVQDAHNFNDLTVDEEVQFASENQQLFTQMSSMTNELKLIESKVIAISRLQNEFSDRVLNQARQIEDIADATVESSENIQHGNTEIRNAIQNKATLRIWILFILIVCSVALLFLDWYS